jgi:hypothetical protein
MSKLGRKLQANGWSRLPDYSYIVYTKNDMKITYSDTNNDYYYLSNVDDMTIIAHSKYFLNTDNLTMPNRHEFFEMLMKARNFGHAKSIMDNYLLEAMIDKTL